MQKGQKHPNSSLSILAIAGVEPYKEKPGEEYMNVDQLAHFKKNFNSMESSAQR
ncbi:hypothetical protein Rin_00006850 [Candidatus Regiella insecticola 5.15]|uniref:Uncharacterized protein n=1 Tax=Candidatus Regiella insecticola 5.15 TaxID=1005043 RepID=G2GY34_9ENTR|nr:hypothetical protein Rin_00006850 [Candidatus Regiella insecticola 5.15]